MKKAYPLGYAISPTASGPNDPWNERTDFHIFFVRDPGKFQKALRADFNKHAPVAGQAVAEAFRAIAMSTEDPVHVPHIIHLPRSPLGICYPVLGRPLIEQELVGIRAKAISHDDPLFWGAASENSACVAGLLDWAADAPALASQVLNSMRASPNHERIFLHPAAREFEEGVTQLISQQSLAA